MEEVRRVHHKSVNVENEERQKGEGKQKKGETPQSESNLGEVWEVAFFSFCYWSRIGCVSVLQQRDRREGREAMVRMQQEVQVKEGRWAV